MQQVSQIDLDRLDPDLSPLWIADPAERRPKVALVAEPFLDDVSGHHSNLPCSPSQSLLSVSGKPTEKVSQH